MAFTSALPIGECSAEQRQSPKDLISAKSSTPALRAMGRAEVGWAATPQTSIQMYARAGNIENPQRAWATGSS